MNEIKKRLSEKANIFSIETDVNSCALSEYVYGKYKYIIIKLIIIIHINVKEGIMLNLH